MSVQLTNNSVPIPVNNPQLVVPYPIGNASRRQGMIDHAVPGNRLVQCENGTIEIVEKSPGYMIGELLIKPMIDCAYDLGAHTFKAVRELDAMTSRLFTFFPGAEAKEARFTCRGDRCNDDTQDKGTVFNAQNHATRQDSKLGTVFSANNPAAHDAVNAQERGCVGNDGERCIREQVAEEESPSLFDLFLRIFSTSSDAELQAQSQAGNDGQIAPKPIPEDQKRGCLGNDGQRHEDCRNPSTEDAKPSQLGDATRGKVGRRAPQPD